MSCLPFDLPFAVHKALLGTDGCAGLLPVIMVSARLDVLTVCGFCSWIVVDKSASNSIL
jgi:hypothetical protein